MLVNSYHQNGERNKNKRINQIGWSLDTNSWTLGEPRDQGN